MNWWRGWRQELEETAYIVWHTFKWGVFVLAVWAFLAYVWMWVFKLFL